MTLSDTDSSVSTGTFLEPVDDTPNLDGGVGLSNAQIGKKRRYALDLVNRLQNTGVQTDIDLPQIAVIGNQSAGKSSLIEAISGITLPRASGTCTRCPTECRLTYAPATPWECKVFIRTIVDHSGQPLGQPRNEIFGDVIHDKTEVEERIRRAQSAILHPHIARDRILTGNEEPEDGTGLSFSPNCVSLQIKGPDVADLSFCDLPGLIRSTSGRDGSENDIKLVESLVESYITKPSCIILLTVSCETDPQNQGALQMAREHDPDGIRTVGVLTKPDRISDGDEEDWVRFIKNEGDYHLLNNWFCVKQPNSTELKAGITWQEARTKEAQFFTTTTPWRDLDTVYLRYLRTGNLVDRLSAILSDLISKRLPEIHNELQQSIQKTREGLNKLPKEPSRDPLSDIAALIHNFTVDLSRLLEGTPEPQALLQSIRPAQEEFKKVIRRTAPEFRSCEKSKLMKSSPAGNGYGDSKQMSTFKFLSNEEGDIEKDMGDNSNEPIYIDDVLRRIQDARTRELPGKSPYIVEEWFIQQITKQWAAPSQHLCQVVYQITLNQILTLVQKHFSEFGQGLLERQARVIIADHLKERFESTKDSVKWLLDLEYRAFTMNTHYLADYKEKFLSYYKASRDEDLNLEMKSTLQGLDDEYSRRSEDSSTLNEVIAGLVKLGLPVSNSLDLFKLLPKDEMEPALEVMADVRAYFQVAYKRFVDNVPLAIDAELVRGAERGLHRTLSSRLGIHEADGLAICKELAAESPQVATRREELGKKLERMKAGSDELSRIS